MKRLLPKSLLAVFVLLVLYLLFWPVNIDPAAWRPPAGPDMSSGVFQVNDRLKAADLISTEPFGSGPEDVAIDTSGYIYAGLREGKILKFQPDGTRPEVLAETEGRPLGLHFDSAGNLVVADALKGLLSIDPAGNIRVLSNMHEATSFGFTDDVDIAADGKMYFSDASVKFPVGHFKDDLFEHRPNGSFYVFNPETGETRQLVKEMYFANGIAVSPDQQFVLIVETSRYRIMRYWLSGPQKGNVDVFIENLPGFPDGVSSNGKGTFWVAMGNPRNATLDKILPHPFLRKIVKRLPEAIQPKETRYSMILGLDMEGNVIHNLQDPEGKIAMISSVQEANGYLYIGSLIDPFFGRIKVPE